MRNQDDMTPKDVALDIATGWIQRAYRSTTGDVDNGSTMGNGNISEGFKVHVRRQLALIHNELAHKMKEGEPMELDEHPIRGDL